jgi:hypothetical protein
MAECKHAKTEETLILDNYKIIQGDTLIRSAVLITECENCKKVIDSVYVAGGCIFKGIIAN